jgi:Protein of unknown function (DUF2996)
MAMKSALSLQLQGVNTRNSVMPEETTQSLQPEGSQPENEAKQPQVTEQATDTAGESSPKAPKAAKAEKGNAPKGKAAKADAGDTPKAKAPKKEAVEDKPFGDFIAQDYLPALEKAFASKNVSDLKLSFDNKQVSGQWMNGQRQFTVYFPQENINAQRAFSCTIGKTPASTIEPFLGDERKITLDLLVFGVIQRVNAEKWFGNN